MEKIMRFPMYNWNDQTKEDRDGRLRDKKIKRKIHKDKEEDKRKRHKTTYLADKAKRKQCKVYNTM
ncbi:hypothetical protein H5410_051071 [Solanum commersonii]|uniref:Uncharacterized protein n=1 Tax=Solanum commersonii TaxID=4109 RepID=A0A9J5WZF4_SOLCO|nr:hypothetical protein H5410_051071 [Solanum commersonii]